MKINLLYYIINMKKSKKHIITSSKSRRMSRKGSKSRRMSKELYIKKNILVGGANTLINQIYDIIESYKKHKIYPFTYPEQWELKLSETNIKIKFSNNKKPEDPEDPGNEQYIFGDDDWLMTINKEKVIDGKKIRLSTKNIGLQHTIISPLYIKPFIENNQVQDFCANESVKFQIINMIKESIYTYYENKMSKNSKIPQVVSGWLGDLRKTIDAIYSVHNGKGVTVSGKGVGKFLVPMAEEGSYYTNISAKNGTAMAVQSGKTYSVPMAATVERGGTTYSVPMQNSVV